MEHPAELCILSEIFRLHFRRIKDTLKEEKEAEGGDAAVSEEKGIPVLINLLAIARYEHMPDYPIQMMVKGTVFPAAEGKAVLKYTESQADEATGEVETSDITLMLESDHVTMVRTGDYSNTMSFSRGKRHEGVYVTPYGEMNMGVLTRELKTKAEPHRGFVHLKYQLDMEGSSVSVNELHLEYFSDETVRKSAGQQS